VRTPPSCSRHPPRHARRGFASPEGNRILRRPCTCNRSSSSLLCVAACSSKLPEPDSAGARTYVHYCSVDGCHGAIPPKQAGARYWDTKLEMMLKVIAQHGSAMPSAAEVEEIRRYLHAHAMHAGG